MVERNPHDGKGVVKEMIEMVVRKWSEMGLHIFKTDEMHRINDEYEEMEEQWSIIDVDKIRANIQNRL